MTSKILLLFLLFCVSPLFGAEIYLAHYEYHEDGLDSFWRCPGGNCTSAINLRSIPEITGSKIIPEGYGIFSYDTAQTIVGSVYLGDDINSRMNGGTKRSVAIALGVERNIVGDTPLDVMWDMLTIHSDPTGMTAPKPLRAEDDGMVRLHFNGVIKEEMRNETHLQREISVFQEDYNRSKTIGVSQDSRQRWTGQTMLKMFGRQSNNLAMSILPEGSKNDGWKHPRTTLGDTFNRADNTNLNASDSGKTKNGGASTWQWVEDSGDVQIVSNAINKIDTGAKTYVRADTDLSDDDHYSQIDIVTNPSTSERQAVLVRKIDSGTITMYRGNLRGSNDNVQMHQVITGVETQLGSNTSVTVSVPDTIKLEVIGSTVKLYWNGSAVITATDTGITGHLTTGFGYGNTSAETSVLDNWEAADFTTTVTARRFWGGFRR